ncbi:hypothetical protein EV670_3116 [Rivibacter subsaxonicus]|uniref:Uncharacterized protein n=2 Tax=Rivibacter subsaxonicus TaxID=457575 RepID=A0A4Q7VH24_9BURK|nr:hypothetical protein EV670_3116 [Rivibacter subsaxonicus]
MAQAALACPRSPVEVVERFMAADCEACWQAAGGAEDARAGRWQFDWIVPAASGEDAALSVAALREAGERITRGGGRAPLPGQGAEQRTPIARTRAPLRLEVQSGPAWNGYLALQYRLAGRAPAGSSVWLAVVEQVAAGDDGTPIARELVRGVAGPFAAGTTASASGAVPMVALRVPQTPQPQRLRGRAWIESREGRIIAVAAENCPWPGRAGQAQRPAQ